MPVLSWLHFGDLHITEAHEPNYRNLLALIDTANRHLAGHVDFAVLPGDNADQGTPEQFRLVRAALDGLRIERHILAGDHDFHSGSLEAFHAVMGAERLPKALTIAGQRCLFLDIVSAGGGGPDFRLGAPQLRWLRTELEAAGPCAVFMHAYPADLQDFADVVAHLLARHRAVCVDMGHTHYNELANDGRTIFMATRSTGQVEEGPPGFAVAAIDDGVVSWRFQPLAGDWPLVLITSPADHRLIRDPASAAQVVRGRARIAAKIWGPADHAEAAIDEGATLPLVRSAEDPSRWEGTFDSTALEDGPHRLAVRAAGGSECITILVDQAGRYAAPDRQGAGSDADAVGAWPDKHIFGTQLGPNRNGRAW